MVLNSWIASFHSVATHFFLLFQCRFVFGFRFDIEIIDSHVCTRVCRFLRLERCIYTHTQIHINKWINVKIYIYWCILYRSNPICLAADKFSSADDGIFPLSLSLLLFLFYFFYFSLSLSPFGCLVPLNFSYLIRLFIFLSSSSSSFFFFFFLSGAYATPQPVYIHTPAIWPEWATANVPLYTIPRESLCAATRIYGLVIQLG